MDALLAKLRFNWKDLVIRRARELRRSVLPYPPVDLWLEATNHCNIHCIMCPHAAPGGLKRPKGFMPPAFFERMILETKGYIRQVSLHFGGESLIHQGLPDLISIASRNGVRTVLHTNGTLLTKERSRKLIDAGLSYIAFSFDGETPEQVERIQAGLKYGKTLANIEGFLKVKQGLRTSRPETYLKVVRPADGGMTGIGAEFRERFRGLPLDGLYEAEMHNWAGAWADHAVETGDTSMHGPQHDRTDRYFPCHYPWTGLTVCWDGRVVACCRDMEGELVVGDLTRQSVMEVWNGPGMVGLRHKLLQRRYRELSPCRNCSELWLGPPEHPYPLAALSALALIVKEHLRMEYPGITGRLLSPLYRFLAGGFPPLRLNYLDSKRETRRAD